MKRLMQIGMLLALLLGMVGAVIPASASSPQNYIVLVGSENLETHVSIMSYFPGTIQIHVGDSVTWKINSHEIHTVTFLAGETLGDLIIPAPQDMASPYQINPMAFLQAMPPNGQYDGSSYVNSGIMSSDPGFVQTFSLTFTREGSFSYVCYVHGEMMSGTIEVVGPNVAVPSPAQVQSQAQAELKAAWLNVPRVVAKANAQLVPPVKNPDGTFTRTILMGYESDNIMVMSFFPQHATVHKGDTVLWKLSDSNTAPHTVTFFNGNPDQPLVDVVPTSQGPVALINPAVLFPSPAVMQGKPLNGTDFFNSGMLIPGVHDTFSITIGDVSGRLNFECILHDSSGMSGYLFVAPGSGN